MSEDGPIIFVDVANESFGIPEVVADSVGERAEQKSDHTELTTKNDVELLIPAVTPRDTETKPRLKCTDCNRFSADTEERLNQHIRRVHRGENPFQCSLCDYSTYNKVVFEEHVRIHQGIKPFKCSFCPYRSASKKNTKKHELIHRPDNPLKCPNCPFIGRNQRVLNYHRINDHTGEKKYKCGQCRKKFLGLPALNAHKRKKCKDCNALFCNEYYPIHRYEAHSVKIKARSPVETFKCKLCDWVSSNLAKILLHLIHHPNQDLSDCQVDISVLQKCGIIPNNVVTGLSS